jgi:hypothetical protein
VKKKLGGGRRMFELTALVLILLTYVVPLNVFIYSLSLQTVTGIISSQNIILISLKNLPLSSYILKVHTGAAAAFVYILYIGLIFLVLYLLFRFVIIKSIYVYLDKEINLDTLLLTYSRGQGKLNIAANIAIVTVLILHLVFSIFDIKVFVLGILSMVFIFKSIRVKPHKNDKKQAAQIEEPVQKTDEGNSIISFEWYYNTDSLGIQRASRFTASISVNMDRYKEYQGEEHIDNSSEVLRKHVLDGICPEIADLAAQIKKQCTVKGFTTFHQASVVMAFQQSLKYVYDIDSKGYEEYVRYPLETLVDKEGDCDCHGICSAAILYAMGYDVVLLKIVYARSEEGHLAIAVEGADGIPGNFYELGGRRYYYCEVTPDVEGKMNFRVGEMPYMTGANVTVIPVKEIVAVQ